MYVLAICMVPSHLLPKQGTPESHGVIRTILSTVWSVDSIHPHEGGILIPRQIKLNPITHAICLFEQRDDLISSGASQFAWKILHTLTVLMSTVVNYLQYVTQTGTWIAHLPPPRRWVFRRDWYSLKAHFDFLALAADTGKPKSRNKNHILVMSQML